jgi:hypothetical protein
VRPRLFPSPTGGVAAARPIRLFLPLLALLCFAGAAAEPAATDYRADALAIEPPIDAQYAYLERFEGGRAPVSSKLRQEAEQVHDRRSLLLYAERALLALADHHAITGASTPHSWAVIPTYADLWVERRGADYVVTAVREGSPAAAAGIRAGETLRTIGGVPVERAVADFWEDLGLPVTQERAGFAARVLAAGRRDAPRALGIGAHVVTLPNLYAAHAPDPPPLTARREGRSLVIRFNNSLGDTATIAAFDREMAAARPDDRIVLDLTDTPSGGNTVVARAIMGWFVARPRPYQVHNLPAEARETGIARQWIEEVLPRPGKHHAGMPLVRVGRWTGSMGEGLAIGFHALGARVVGDRMAGLFGAVYDHRLPNSGLVLKLPTERLYATDGTPREAFKPEPTIGANAW